MKGDLEGVLKISAKPGPGAGMLQCDGTT